MLPQFELQDIGANLVYSLVQNEMCITGAETVSLYPHCMVFFGYEYNTCDF